ncbi:hypothetical protein SAMN05216353_105101 [Halobacillus alkaliphilus]|uniref:Uncharacterized protein n=1 Tax=Halobacillus alkaliphilus TaxID=396056 RepID=A0A1I2KMU2_9BACI|nr:hypothetical protein [Halobacillus alkaliphilus]SFF68312.1 hypothetical protein SAMN05216353_105101 [Halobacillus alkaliphilus]
MSYKAGCIRYLLSKDEQVFISLILLMNTHKKTGIQKEEIWFSFSNPWDIAGAASFDFHTVQLNHSKQKWPEIGRSPISHHN